MTSPKEFDAPLPCFGPIKDKIIPGPPTIFGKKELKYLKGPESPSTLRNRTPSLHYAHNFAVLSFLTLLGVGKNTKAADFSASTI